MFLTSNRVSVFDQAVKSRIHMALQYSPPGPEIRRLIWRNHLSRVPASECDIDVEQALDVLRETEMNGREISNAINTARTLAKSEGQRLSLEYLSTIVMVWGEFEKSLKTIQAVDAGTGVKGKP
jgi:AAA+ superfamily predicted ATPase